MAIRLFGVQFFRRNDCVIPPFLCAVKRKFDFFSLYALCFAIYYYICDLKECFFIKKLKKYDLKRSRMRINKQ